MCPFLLWAGRTTLHGHELFHSTCPENKSGSLMPFSQAKCMQSLLAVREHPSVMCLADQMRDLKWLPQCYTLEKIEILHKHY